MERVYYVNWCNSHQSLFSGRNIDEARQQACLLYGRDAWKPLLTKVRRATPEDINRVTRKGGYVLRFKSMLAPRAEVAPNVGA